MLESNPSRNSRLETHLKDEQGRLMIGAPYHSDRFPHAFRNSSRKCRREAASLSFHPACGSGESLRPVLNGEADEVGAVRLR